MKGLTAEIFKWALGDCSNGGISSRVNKVTIVGEGRETEIFEADADAPAVYIERRELYGEVVLTARPVGVPHGMFGGTFIYTSDSRMTRLGRFSVPIPLHDRVE